MDCKTIANQKEGERMIYLMFWGLLFLGIIGIVYNLAHWGICLGIIIMNILLVILYYLNWKREVSLKKKKEKEK